MASMIRTIKRHINRKKYGKHHSGGYLSLSAQDKKEEKKKRAREYRQMKAKMRSRRRRKMFQRLKT